MGRSTALVILLCMLAPPATRSSDRDHDSQLVADLLAAGVPAGRGRSASLPTHTLAGSDHPRPRPSCTSLPRNWQPLTIWCPPESTKSVLQIFRHYCRSRREHVRQDGAQAVAPKAEVASVRASAPDTCGPAAERPEESRGDGAEGRRDGEGASRRQPVVAAGEPNFAPLEHHSAGTRGSGDATSIECGVGVQVQSGCATILAGIERVVAVPGGNLSQRSKQVCIDVSSQYKYSSIPDRDS